MNTEAVNSWAKYTSWQSVKPPSRPDIWQIEICRKTLLELPKLHNVAVLGSTIEYRDLLADMGGLEVFVFDRNKNFYDYITKFTKQKLNETFVDGNWLETVGNFVNYFDAVLSDLTSGNISYDQRETFYQGIAASMSKGAVFFDRMLLKTMPFLDIHDLIKKYTNLTVSNDTVNSFNCEVLFCSTLLDNYDNILDSTAFYDYLLKLDIPRVTDFVKACYDITPRDCIWWYSHSWDIEQQLYTKYFCVQQEYEEPVQSEYFGRAKLLISSSKGHYHNGTKM
jgi:hypothetical protein